MQKRETHKRFDFNGRSWSIGKFDPMTGSYIAYKLMSELVPMIPGLHDQLGVPIPQGAQSMSKADFLEMQKDCLGVCSELLPAGPAPVINSNGTYGVQDFDMKTALALTIQALVWNLQDFFDESLWSSLFEGLQSIFPLGAKTLTNSSTPQ